MFVAYCDNKVIATSNLFEEVCDNMCYRYARPRWFNSIDDAEKAICNCGENNLPKVYDFSSFKEVEIYEAVIKKGVTKSGKTNSTRLPKSIWAVNQVLSQPSKDGIIRLAQP